jgi:hypothetical protein
MRDILLGRKVGSATTVLARREKRMIEACECRILEFPLGTEACAVAKELNREGWYAWASDYEVLFFESSACGRKPALRNFGIRSVRKCDFTNLLSFGKKRLACEKRQLLFRLS